MIKRPKPTDTEDDILEMQKSFLAEQAKNTAFQPAAQLVKVEPRKCSMPKAAILPVAVFLQHFHLFAVIF